MKIDFSDIEPGFEVSESKFSPIPPGVYRVCINEAKLGQSRSGKDMVIVEFIVSEGSYKAKTQKKWFVVDSKVGRAVFKQFLETVSSKALESFDTEHLPKIVGKELLIRTNLETNGGFRNCVIKALYKLSDQAKAESDFNGDHEPVAEDKEIPF